MAFKVDRRLQDGWEKVELEDDRSGSLVEIIPGAGAIINSWTVLINGKSLNIIDGYTGKEDFEKNVHNGFKSAKLSPFVCRLKDASFQWEGRKYRVRKFMLNDEAIHGLLYDAIFKVGDTKITEDSCSVEMAYHYQGDFPGFPFKYNCTVRYTMTTGNRLTIQTEISNALDAPSAIPVADGWHPYFSLGGKVDGWWLQLASNQMLEYDERLLPTGKLIFNEDFREGRTIGDTKLDNGFLLEENTSPFCILKNPANNISVEFISARNYPYLQLYIPEHRQSIAIENLSSAPDAFNNGIGLTILKPGEKKSFEVGVRIADCGLRIADSQE